MSTPYDREFFQKMDFSASQSAEVIVPLVMALLRPKSVLDVGAGTGGWAAEFARQGVTDFLCVDGDQVESTSLQIPTENFHRADVSQPLDIRRRYDLAVCLEVAEHLPESAADIIVASLTRHAGAVLFSAAIPNQGGTDHINEQWPDYWAKIFAQHGYCCFDCIRWAIWADPRVAFFYKQNTVVYLSKAVADTISDDRILNAIVAQPPSVVHPEAFLNSVSELDAMKTQKYVPGLRWALRAVPISVVSSVRRRLAKIVGKLDR